MRFILILAAMLIAVPAAAETVAQTTTAPAGPVVKRLAGDTNKDGQWDEAEYTAMALRRFKAMDANGDGLVTQEEKKIYDTRPRGVQAKKQDEAEKPSFMNRFFN